jgi:heptosyltransferase-1
MGDIIHAMVALQYIKKQEPTLQIDWIVEEGFKQILENNPDIDNILTVNLKSIKKDKMALFLEIKKIKTYAQNNYDLVIDAQGLLKSAISAKLLGKKVAGFSKESIRESIASLFYKETVNIDYSANAIERNVKILGEPLGVSINKEEILKKEPFLHFNHNSQLPMQIDDYVLFIVGASKTNKIYPKELFLEIAQQLNEKVLVIWANAYEKEVADYLDENSEKVSASPKLNLDQLKRVVAESKLVIGGDTGPTHMAWALNIPSVTIFGNTPEHRNTYLTSINRVVKSKSFVDPLKLNKNDFSISEIEPQEIVKIAKELLA